ncbi:MAG: ABC transporter substrate-binding protein [Chloroflexi bacterium]|nr:ABC transporter substrate-binding protein [Chloroflexota bacterium]
MAVRNPFSIRRLALAGLILLILASAGCSAAGNQPNEASAPVEIKIAMIPIVDGLPFYVAEKQGYFKENNLNVTIIPAASAAERDQLIAAGQAVGMINDLLSVALYNKQETQVQIVRIAHAARPDSPMYRVMASAKSGITSPAELAGVPIGISQGTVIEYVTDRLLEKAGLAEDQIESMAVPKMPERLALLGSGELKAATLPEPFSTIAEQGGAVTLIDDSQYTELGISVVSFRKAFIDENPQAVQGFMAAIEKAVADINQDPETWRPLLAEKKLIPEALKDTYPVPQFPGPSVPDEAQFADMIDWAKSHALIEKDLPYSESVTDRFLDNSSAK